jgi:cellulose synthase/poly-beta-1,6-N-acetylglucosamine synthase-like glycosyltransferase
LSANKFPAARWTVAGEQAGTGMNCPLVSIITPTWKRRDLLVKRALPSVAAQDYPNIEHVVVSDGPVPIT